MGTVIDISEALGREKRLNQSLARLAELKDHFVRGLINDEEYEREVRKHLEDVTDFYSIPKWRGIESDD